MRHETGSEGLDRVYNRVGKISSRHNCLEAALIEMWLVLIPAHEQESHGLQSSCSFSKLSSKLKEKASEHEALDKVSISKICELVDNAKNSPSKEISIFMQKKFLQWSSGTWRLRNGISTK
ncbi:MAG: hypothetical protein R3C58_10055 [Parvularculaceae bacterium]